MTTTANTQSAEKIHLIQATTTPDGEVKFVLPIKPELVQSVEAIDLDLMLVSSSGEKYILQQGALLATTNSESKLVFSNGDAMSAADQIKRMGVLKPVEGGSFRLASALTPEAADKVTGNEFGLGKDTQDTVAKIEKLLQSLESATQPSQNSEASNSSAAPGKNSAFKSNADPLASPAPGTPPKPETQINENVSTVKVNDTPRSFTGSSQSEVSGVIVTKITEGSQTISDFTSKDVALSQIDLTQVNKDKTINISLKSQFEFQAETTTKTDPTPTLNATLKLPGVLNADKLILTVSGDTLLPPNFKIQGSSFDVREVTVNGATTKVQVLTISDLKSLTDLSLPVSWTADTSNTSQLQKPSPTFSIGVKFYQGATALDYGNAPLNIVYGDDLPLEKLDSNSNVKIFLSKSGYSYNITGTDSVDSITGGSVNDTLNGNKGNDTLIGGAGADALNGGDGLDTASYLTASTGVTASLDDPRVNTGDAAGDTYDSIEILEGSKFNDSLTGDDQDNTLDGGAGNDTMIGGSGDDTYKVDSSADVITEALNEGIDTVESTAASYILSANVEHLTLKGTSNSSGTGNDLANTITGNSANNTLDGGAGNDTLIGSEGNDTLDGSDGIDTASYLTASTGVTASLDDPKVNTGDAEGDTYTSIEILEGSKFDDSLTGDSQDNTLIGGAGKDHLIGRGGNDTASYSTATTSITASLEDSSTNTGDAAGDTYTSIENLEGSKFNDSLTGDDQDNTLDGGAGNDTLDGGAGNDTMIGGSGDDTYKVDSSADVITEALNEGIDTVESTAASYILSANVEHLTLKGTSNSSGTGNDLANTITGNSANNTLDGGAGNDTMIGGSGDDTYKVDSSADVITEALNEGIDTVESTAASYILSANVEHLTLKGTSNSSGTGNDLANTITGNSANNTLDGGAGNDTMIGGSGDDTYKVDSSADVITEALNEGIDTVESTAASYTLSANVEHLTLKGTSNSSGTGNDLANTITGNSANNTLDGGAGNDTLDGGAGNDTMIGGSGDDTYKVDSSADVITEALNEGIDTVESTAASYILSANVEHLTLKGTSNSSGTGNDLANTITGNSANNTLDGGAGNDTLDGGAGNDTMIGGSGDDTYKVDSSADVITEALNEGIDTVESTAASYILSANVEHLTLKGTSNSSGTGNDLANTITGNSANNTLDGGAGNDTMIGGSGDDTYKVDSSADVITEALNEGIDTVESTAASYILSANVEHLTLKGTSNSSGTGNDLANTITGNSANNTLDGGAGNDTLDGGAGNDTMIGGSGDDTYKVDSSADVITEALNEGIDTVESTAASYILSANVEHLTLKGTSNSSGTGNDLANTITGNSANNTLDGGAENDTMIGGSGDDTYKVDSSADVITEALNEGIDTVESTAASYILSANVEHLTLKGTSNSSGTGNDLANTITGNSANNTLDGGAENDTMIGGSGDDTYKVDSSADVITEALNEGIDTVESTAASYILSANVEHLTLKGTSNSSGTGNDLANTITGNSANNTLDGGAENDTMIGGSGDDTYKVDSSADVITEALNEGIDTVESTAASYILSANVEHLTLKGTSNSSGTGNDLANTITGNSANNTLDGGAGNDTLDGGAGNDTMIGGSGDDTYKVDSSADVITEALNEGIDTVESTAASYILSANVEHLTLKGTSNSSGTGNDLANTITGNSANNTLDGGAENDTMIGGSGDDTYKVDSSADVITEALNEGIDTVESTAASYILSANVEHLTLKGTSNSSGTGNDLANTITGNSANNTLDGGAGNDIMIGGTGNDTYILDTLNDVVTESSSKTINGTDTIQVKGITSFSLGALKATNIEIVDLSADTNANTMNISSAAIQNIVGTGDGSVLSLKIGANDVINIQNESGISYTGSGTSGPINFYASSDTSHTTLLAQINFIS